MTGMDAKRYYERHGRLAWLNLCERAGCTRWCAWAYAAGLRRPSPETARRIAAADPLKSLDAMALASVKIPWAVPLRAPAGSPGLEEIAASPPRMRKKNGNTKGR